MRGMQNVCFDNESIALGLKKERGNNVWPHGELKSNMVFRIIANFNILFVSYESATA